MNNERKSASCCQRRGTSAYGTGDELYNELYAHLEANGVKLSIRRGMLRFSLHLYNNADDVAKVLELTRQFLKK